MDLDTSKWSGDGDFVSELLGVLQSCDDIAAIRVEDAPSSGTGAGYSFLATEVFILFATEIRRERRSRFLPFPRATRVPRLTLQGLEARLATVEGVGRPDYSDEGMLQYLRTQRVVQPYQTRGYKLVEMVRIYEIRANEHSRMSRHHPERG